MAHANKYFIFRLELNKTKMGIFENAQPNNAEPADEANEANEDTNIETDNGS